MLVGDLFNHTVARWVLKAKVLEFCICKRSIMYILDDGMLDIMDDGYDRVGSTRNEYLPDNRSHHILQ